MKNTIILLLLAVTGFSYAQEKKDSTLVFKKRVLDATEVDFASSYYNQNGNHAAVSGGLGTEKLSDFATNIVVATPLNDDDVLTFDIGVSAYTSASSSNVNPFPTSSSSTGASGQTTEVLASNPKGTPWQASSGASRKGDLYALNASYSHSSNDRNFIWNADVALSTEFNYSSRGLGGGITRLFNEKNSEISIKVNAYFDNWKIIYPTELNEYNSYGNSFLTSGHFKGVIVYDKDGNQSNLYRPSTFQPWNSTVRDSYSSSISFSQIVSKRMQFSLFFDLLQQQGMLSTPYQRMYFADKQHFFIGDKQFIPVYQSSSNTGVYELADDIERLPSKRFKLPIGLRWNYFINEKATVRTYYRYYQDDWGVKGHTFNIELPIKINDLYTVYPMYRYYVQTQSKFFAPFEQHLSTEQYYTSDYDLSAFSANQYGLGATYTDLLEKFSIFGLGLKNIDFRFNHYTRTDGLSANIGTIAFKFLAN